MTVSPAWDESRAHGRAVPDVDSPQFAADLAATAEKMGGKDQGRPVVPRRLRQPRRVLLQVRDGRMFCTFSARAGMKYTKSVASEAG